MLLTFLWSFSSFAQVPVGVQDGTTSTIPISGNWGYTYSQQLAYQSEINAQGDITSISFYFASGTNTASSTEWTVYLGHTSKTAFDAGADWVASSAMTEVYDGTVSFPADGNQMQITFDTPFAYNNTDNLVVAVHESEPDYGASISFGKTANLGANRAIYYRSDSNNPDPTSPPSGTTLGYINNIILGGITQTCPTPLDLAVSNVDLTSADLTWTETGSSTAWEVLYGVAGFDPATAGTNVSVTTTPQTSLSGLTSATSYDVYVKAVCAVGDESSWSGPISFMTPCNATTVPYVMDFNDAIVPELPTCTSKENAGSGNNWTTQVYSSNGMSGNALRYLYNSSNNANAWFYTQGIELVAGVDYQISYKYFGSSNYPEKMKVAYGTSPSSASMTVELADHANIIAAVEEEYTFTVSADGVYYFGFNAYSDADRNALYLDDISISVAPSCLPVADLTATNISTDSANLSWTAGQDEEQWEVLYGQAGFDLVTEGTTLIINDDAEATLSSLDSGTGYDFYVRAICGTDDKSDWTGPIGFITNCEPGDIPFVESFENGYTYGASLALCWSQTSVEGSNVWTTNNADTSYNRAPRTGDWNVYLRYANTAWMYYALELTADTQYELEFYARQNTTSGATIEAAYGSTNDPAAMTNTIIAEAAVVDGDYQRFSGFFTPTTTGVYYVGIKGALTSAPWYLSIDDIRVDVAPTCLAPTAPMAENISVDSADLSWTAGDAETEWQVLYGIAGFDPATEGTSVEVNDDAEVTITGLDANTEYDFYVKAICAVGDESAWTDAVSFTTSCVAGSVPFFEGFEIGQTPGGGLAGCWTQESIVGTQVWTVNDEETTYNRTPRTGDRNVYLRWLNEDWMFYPLNLTADTSYELEFFARQDGTTGASIEAAFGTSADAASMTNAIIALSPVIDGNYQRFSGEFTPTTTGVYYIGIKGTTTVDPYYISIDDISVVEAAVTSCAAPTDLAVSNISGDAADLSWTAGGEETEWKVLYGEAGFDPATAGTSVDVDGTPETTLTDLDEDTEYEFYVRAICGEGDESAWTGPVAFTTTATICEPTTVPYALDFEEVTTPALPECTTVQNVGDGNNWETASANGNGFNSNVLRYKYHLTSPGNTWFYTQGIELEAGVAYQISYKYGNNAVSAFVESMKVAYGTSPYASAMTNELADYPSVSGGAPTVEELTFTVEADGVYYFGFNAYSPANQFYLYLDDIMIDVSEDACDAPTDVVVNDISETTATVTWTASTTATEGYDVEVYLEGSSTLEFTEHVATGITTANITGLLADTSYDVYVISNCGDDMYAASDVVSFTTIDLGVNSNDLTKISYFPNPVKDQLTITAAGNVETVTVTNLLGQTVMQVQPRSTNVVLDMSALPVGTYILKANVDSAISTFKVIKE